MTNLDLIRQKCIEANPEIVRLTFGCEFASEDGRHFIYHVSQNHPAYFEAKTDGTNGHYRDFPKEHMTIYGRPIRLADVLLAIASRGPNAMPDVFVGDAGGFYGIDADERRHSYGCHWNCAKDDLTKNPQTWDFLVSLLK